MKTRIIRTALLFGYCVPFVFLAMNEDATVGTLWCYLIMIIGFVGLSYLSVKTKNFWIVAVGNFLSFLSSCIFAWNFRTEKWEYYFKPFLPNGLIVFESVIAVIIQLVILKYLRNKDEKQE